MPLLSARIRKYLALKQWTLKLDTMGVERTTIHNENSLSRLLSPVRLIFRLGAKGERFPSTVVVAS